MTEPKTKGLGSSYGQETNIFGHHGGKDLIHYILNKVIQAELDIFFNICCSCYSIIGGERLG